MARYVVNFEYVPMDGEPPYSDEELVRFAVAMRSALSEHESSARGACGRLRVALELDAQDERSARRRGLDLTFAGILSSGLRTYRLGTVEVSRVAETPAVLGHQGERPGSSPGAT